MSELRSFVPMTGRGAFDVSYVKNSGMMAITVNIFPMFENRPVEGVSWDQRSQIEFKMTAQQSVQQNWNDKHRLVNRTKNPIETVSVVFGVRFVDAADQATVIMHVPRYASAYGPAGLARCDSYVGLSQIDSGNIRAQSQAMVHSQSTTPINVKLTEAGNVSRDEQRRIEDLIMKLKLNEIALDPHGNMTPQLKVDLANLCLQIKTGPPSRPLVPLIIKAHFNSFLGTSAGKVVKLMRAMLDQFRVFCLNNPVSIVQPPVNDLNLSSPGRIELICDQSFPASFNEDMWMNIFAHEYGHMIGLPDEYDACPASTDRSSKALAINRFLAMCEVHGVQPPRMGAMTTSIMCKGRDVLPCHMLPALEAIRRITDEEGWRIG